MLLMIIRPSSAFRAREQARAEESWEYGSREITSVVPGVWSPIRK